ncbi:hypothetical protein EUTSA_v10026452mg [Eutrema salsugineum]|uniref:Bifunctional inhibitor/plant lipid transfer protein/seed storage helical domain-containing protein n=1 Tax=Eutrema salsugineum TaxID=72664 RepID=V4LZJ9_EUTSA|nr:hypothetical protein EUTSA_v10026452mg [Eutrema salsugineum]
MKPEMCLLLLLAVVSTISAQSSCTDVIFSMAPCLVYVTGNSSSPSQQCCNQLATVVRSSPECLCEVLSGGGSQLVINVNETQALALPKACNVQTPPVSRCNGGSSVNSPAGSSNTSEHGNGSKTVPGDRSSSDLWRAQIFFLFYFKKSIKLLSLYEDP